RASGTGSRCGAQISQRLDRSASSLQVLGRERPVRTLHALPIGYRRYSRFPICATNSRSGGSVLVGLLWCVAILSVLVIGVLRTARMDLLVVKNHGDVIQAHYLALAGIEKAKALLYRDARERKRSAKNHSGELYDAPKE